MEPADFDYIGEILRTRQVSQGRYVQALEDRFRRLTATRYACAVASGTAALHLALVALGVDADDEVIAPSYTCAAVLHAIHYTGARPVLVDIDPVTLNPTASMIRHGLTRRTKAIIVTHTFGFPASMDGITRLGPAVIEDCAHALGATFRGEPVGSLGQISIFSLYSTKVICAGEGGMVCSNDRDIGRRVRDLNRPDQRVSYRVRFNYKMSDLVAGLALRQSARLPSMLARRRAIAARYCQAFQGAPVAFQEALPGAEPTYYRFVVSSPRAATIIRAARRIGIGCDRPVFRPLHRYLAPGPRPALATTEAVWRSTLSIPLYPDLREAEIRRVMSGMRRVLGLTARGR